MRDGNLYTSAGISAGIDLALALVEEDWGRQAALDIARNLVLYLRRSGGQAQFSTRLRAQYADLPVIRSVQAWCLDNLGENITVAAMARRAAMSERSFARVFRQQTGTSPGEFLAGARVDAAREMLEESSQSIDAVARRCGFAGAGSLRRAFVREFGVTPIRYREKFEAAGEVAAGGDFPGFSRAGAVSPGGG